MPSCRLAMTNYTARAWIHALNVSVERDEYAEQLAVQDAEEKLKSKYEELAVRAFAQFASGACCSTLRG